MANISGFFVSCLTGGIIGGVVGGILGLVLACCIAIKSKDMEMMLNEQKNQGERLDVIEARDGEMWRKAIGYLVTGIIGIVLGYIFKQIGM